MPEIPPHIEKVGITPTPTQFTSKVTNDQGQNLIQTPASQAVTITIPADAKFLKSRLFGSKENAVVWFAAFWLRMIKKAVHFGWRVINPKS